MPFIEIKNSSCTISPPKNDFSLVNTYSISFDACNDDGSGGCTILSSHSFTALVINDAPVYDIPLATHSTQTL